MPRGIPRGKTKTNPTERYYVALIGLHHKRNAKIVALRLGLTLEEYVTLAIEKYNCQIGQMWVVDTRPDEEKKE